MSTKKSKKSIATPPIKRKAASAHRVFKTTVEVGDLITFDPTGEQLKIAKIERGRITFEKRP